jgi:ribosome maturation factor RimP
MPPLELVDICRKVDELALPFAKEAGLELVEITAHFKGRDVEIEILADRPEGGITIEECATLNKSVALAIDENGFLGEDYTLGVSSPGLDRPMTTLKDFQRNLNFKVRFFLKERFEGKMEYEGTLTAVSAEGLTVTLKKKKTIMLPMSLIDKGLLVI